MADEFEWYELAIYDIHCRPKGRLVARRRMAEILKHGMGMFGGICFFGMQDQPTVCGALGEDYDYGNMNLKPLMNTLTKSFAAAASGNPRVGHVICNLEQMDGQLVTSCPRTVAEIQLNRLAELGLTIRSSSEIEILVRDSKTSANFSSNGSWSSIPVLEDIQELLLELTDTLKEVGVFVDTAQVEEGAGQFEFTLDVQTGIQGPDSSARFKNCVKTFFAKRGLDASFMTRVTLSHANNGMHFNHSLWREDGTNAFLEAGQADKLSPLCRHWMAGILHHAAALTALSCPTANCYRRIGCPWAPHYADWGLGYRLATLRVKVDGGDNVYVENRLPSSASNPYLVMAATIAAGLDGVQRKLPLPAAKSPSAKLPTDLGTALKALEADSVLVDALGAQLVEYFLYSKRTYELEKLDQSLADEHKILQELEMYYKQA